MYKYPRHQQAIEYAMTQIKQSPLFPYVVEIIPFGSVARSEERFDSDIDLLLVLDEQAKTLKKERIYLKSAVTSDDFTQAETDLKITFNKDWRNPQETIYQCIRKDGQILWTQTQMAKKPISLMQRMNKSTFIINCGFFHFDSPIREILIRIKTDKNINEGVSYIWKPQLLKIEKHLMIILLRIPWNVAFPC